MRYTNLSLQANPFLKAIRQTLVKNVSSQYGIAQHFKPAAAADFFFFGSFQKNSNPAAYAEYSLDQLEEKRKDWTGRMVTFVFKGI